MVLLMIVPSFPFQVLLSSSTNALENGDETALFGTKFKLDKNQQPLTVKSRVVFVPQCVVDNEKTVILMHHELEL